VNGKYQSKAAFWFARAQRECLRTLLRGLVRWPMRSELEPGCTAIIGMCSRLPEVIEANVACLHAVRWPELRRVVIAVDGKRGCLAPGLEARVQTLLGDLPCEFVYYTPLQSRIAELVALPYVYAWLSWAIAIGRVETESLLIHDYDALLLTDSVAACYREFRTNGAVMQGVRWYKNNGIEDSDRLAATFEAFVDLRWLRRFAPIRMFHQVGSLGGRFVDFDILLELQANAARPDQRTVVPLQESDLTHPSQMIHQYTMFRREPAGRLPCYSIPMIPFFAWLGGNKGALESATALLRPEASHDVRLLGDGVRVNLALLRAEHVDWLLKQMLQACVSLRVLPARDLLEYGEALYGVAGVPAHERWRNHFLADQLAWVARASV